MNLSGIITPLLEFIANLSGKVALIWAGEQRQKNKTLANANKELKADAETNAKPMPVDRSRIYNRLRGKGNK